MIDPSIIDERIRVARDRDTAVTSKLLKDISRLPVVAPYQEAIHSFDLNQLNQQLKPGRLEESGLPPNTFVGTPDNGSFAYQLYSSICFAIDARAELKLLELIASPDFYAALMRSAGTIEP